MPATQAPARPLQRHLARVHPALMPSLLLCAVALSGCVIRRAGVGPGSQAPTPAGAVREAPTVTAHVAATPTMRQEPRPTATDTAQPAWLRLVGHLGGNQANAVAVRGRYAYVGFGCELVALDVADAARPRRVGRLVLPAAVADLATTGTYCYVAGGEAGLLVVDVTDPAQPALLRTLALSGANGVVVLGGRVVVSGRDLHVLDVSSPAAPTEVGRFSLSGPDGPVGRVSAALGDHVYTAYQTYDLRGGFRILDVSDAARPVQVGHWGSASPVMALALAGKYVCLLAGRPDSGVPGDLHIVDVSNPREPVEVGQGVGERWLGERLAMDGSRLYVARSLDLEQGASVQVLDVANPESPVPVAHYEGLPAPVWGMAIADDRAYIAGNGLVTIDLSRPAGGASPVRYENAPGVGLGLEGRDLAVAGGYAYVAAGWDGLLVIDVSDPANPALAGALDTAGHAWDVAVAGPFAYVADEYNGLRVIDVSNPRRPVEVGSYDVPGPAEFFHGVAVAGRYAYVAEGLYERTGLRVVDISNPRLPREAGFLPLTVSGEGALAPRAEDVAVADGHVYLAAGTAGLRVIDVSDPAAPKEVGSFDTPGRAASLAVAGEYVYLVDGDLRVIHVSDPAAPAQVGFYDVPETAAEPHVVVQEGRVFLSGQGLLVLDASSLPRLIVVAEHPWVSGGVAVAGEMIYGLGPGLVVLSVPRAP